MTGAASPLTPVELWTRLTTTKSLAVPGVVILVNLIVSIVTNQVVLRDFPNSADEYGDVIMAQTFAEGKLSVPSPIPPEFFTVIHVINDGRFYGKYEPGWAMLLAVGVLLGIPWLVNSILGALTLWATYAMARRHFTMEVANISMYLALANPFLAFNSASYFNHPACLFFLTLFLAAYLECTKDPSSKASAYLMGASGGMAFLIRPYTAVAVVFPLVVYFAYRCVRERQLRTLSAAVCRMAAPAIAFLAVYLLYNYLQTGNALLSPRAQYAGVDRPFSVSVFPVLLSRMETHLWDRIWSLVHWMPLAPLFVFLSLVYRETRQDSRILRLATVLGWLLLAHFFYHGIGGNRYGPRHLYEAASAVLIVSAAVVRSAGGHGFLMVAGVLLLNGVQYAANAGYYLRQVRERTQVFDLVKRQGVSNAIVFMSTGSGSMPRGDLLRNGIHFDQPVLYVYDLGPQNDRLRSLHPTRKAWRYRFDRSTREGALLPYNSSD